MGSHLVVRNRAVLPFVMKKELLQHQDFFPNSVFLG